MCCCQALSVCSGEKHSGAGTQEHDLGIYPFGSLLIIPIAITSSVNFCLSATVNILSFFQAAELLLKLEKPEYPAGAHIVIWLIAVKRAKHPFCTAQIACLCIPALATHFLAHILLL